MAHSEQTRTASACWRAADQRDPKFLLPEKNIRREQGKIRYGGYYTQDDIREIVAYAAQRGIEVIPEIDLPGHSLAAIGCYPQLACDGRGGWGKHFSTPLCIGRDSTIAFCKNVLTELFDLFPSQYVHIGGDEVERTPWETCPGLPAAHPGREAGRRRRTAGMVHP